MIKIITESGSDMSQLQAKMQDFTVLPLHVSFEEETFLDGIDIDHKEFFNRLIESDVLPKTSLVTPNQYEEVFNDEDQFVVITVSKALSGCYQSAMIARNDRENIYVVDSESAAIGERILVELALKMRNQGYSAAQIAETLETKKKDIRLIALVDTLEYLKKGGRISPAVAAIGTVLSIKPVITLKDGVIEVLGKARGSRNGANLLRQMVNKNGEIDFDSPFALAYSGLDNSLLVKYINDNVDLWSGKTDNLPVYTIGSAIGTHAGPGAIALAYFAK